VPAQKKRSSRRGIGIAIRLGLRYLCRTGARCYLGRTLSRPRPALLTLRSLSDERKGFLRFSDETSGLPSLPISACQQEDAHRPHLRRDYRSASGPGAASPSTRQLATSLSPPLAKHPASIERALSSWVRQLGAPSVLQTALPGDRIGSMSAPPSHTAGGERAPRAAIRPVTALGSSSVRTDPHLSANDRLRHVAAMMTILL